jgi:hypothetical protein
VSKFAELKFSRGIDVKPSSDSSSGYGELPDTAILIPRFCSDSDLGGGLSKTFPNSASGYFQNFRLNHVNRLRPLGFRADYAQWIGKTSM